MANLHINPCCSVALDLTSFPEQLYDHVKVAKPCVAMHMVALLLSCEADRHFQFYFMQLHMFHTRPLTANN